MSAATLFAYHERNEISGLRQPPKSSSALLTGSPLAGSNSISLERDSSRSLIPSLSGEYATRKDQIYKKDLPVGPTSGADIDHAVSSDGMYLAVGYYHNHSYSVEIWTFRTRKLHQTRELNLQSINPSTGPIAFVPISNLLAIQFQDSDGTHLQIWDILGRSIEPYVVCKNVKSTTYSNNGTLLATSTPDEIRIVDMQSGEAPCPSFPCKDAQALAIDEFRLAITSESYKVSIWSWRTRTQIKSITLTCNIYGPQWSPDMQTLIFMTMERESRRPDMVNIVLNLCNALSDSHYRIQLEVRRKEIEWHRDSALPAALSYCGNYLAIYQGNRIKVIPRTENRLDTFGVDEPPRSMRFLQDGTLVIGWYCPKTETLSCRELAKYGTSRRQAGNADGNADGRRLHTRNIKTWRLRRG
ncbi:hypothetical protein EJ04DRAFT_80431 [Polyplosphaeria fusca]|uniref:Uncharacterized protein n=1 Tax=Polyplosphaeria fusca TaxID=682080 RepID=A0A9P4V674_9PLEO|nr:hypothetical protein EJ04DRAFT_80431 [Polyplosphaeria fusca]